MYIMSEDTAVVRKFLKCNFLNIFSDLDKTDQVIYFLVLFDWLSFFSM